VSCGLNFFCQLIIWNLNLPQPSKEPFTIYLDLSEAASLFGATDELIKITALWDVRLYSLVIRISNYWQWHTNNWIYVTLMVVVKLIIGWMSREEGVAKVIYVASFWRWHCLDLRGKHHKRLCNVVWYMTYWFKGVVVGNIKTWFGSLFFFISLSSHMSN
jgi:hypothetical protein